MEHGMRVHIVLDGAMVQGLSPPATRVVLSQMDTFEIAAPEVLAEDFGGEIVAINMENGRYYSLRGLAYAIWGDLVAGHGAADIRDAITAVDYSLGVASAAFIQRLSEEGLVRIRDASAAPTAPLASASAAHAGMAAPQVETFDDMADLIKADPIHDVDEEFGWPVRKE